MADLQGHAEGFANELNALLEDVFGISNHFEPTAIAGEDRVVIKAVGSEQVGNRSPLKLYANGVALFDVFVEFLCAWDREQAFLSVEHSSIEVGFSCAPRPCLFRYDFVKNMKSKRVPRAHFHVSAHRDAFTQAMTMAGTQTRRARGRGNEMSKALTMEEVHFPVGGSRFRPTLEDVLQLLIEEFGVTANEQWQVALRKRRRDWERKQLAAAVRDDPEQAIKTLERLGYVLSESSSGHTNER